jgi:hypothetical protein
LTGNQLDDLLSRLQKLPADQAAIAKKAIESTRDKVWIPNPGPQTQAYYSPADLLYYGGAAGGGKSQLLMGLAINEHRVSRLFRRHFKDVEGEGGLVPGLAQILGSSTGYNSQKHVWQIPGKTRRAVEFGAFETPKEAEAYQGRAADFIGFDEAVQFQEAIVRFIIGWNRTAIAGQRCRAVLASNPPLTPEGLWIFEWFAPWLDPEHPIPAKPGELRYFANVNGHDIEVERDYVGLVTDANGNEMEVRPKSRTFIPASLSDNPDLLDTGYASQLAALPKHLQSALLQGKFTSTLEDADRQIIPAEWVLKAQQRWMMRKGELKTKPMTSLGVDVADGGADRMVCIPLHGVVYGEPKIKQGVEVKTTEQKVAMVVNAAKDDPQMNIDCGGGYGGGLSDTLETNGFNVVRCKGAMGSSAYDRERVRGFANKRAEWVWRLREGLDPEKGDNIALPPGRELLMELTAFREKAHADMRSVIQIEDNEEISKRIGRSPDIAWSIIFAWAEPDTQRKSARTSTHRRRPDERSLPVIKSQYAKVVGRKN